VGELVGFGREEAECVCISVCCWRQDILRCKGNYCARGKTPECLSFLPSLVGLSLRFVSKIKV
jgi:hypothetical protein